MLVVDWNGAAARASTTAIGVPNLREQHVHVTLENDCWLEDDSLRRIIFQVKTTECVSNAQRRKHVYNMQ